MRLVEFSLIFARQALERYYEIITLKCQNFSKKKNTTLELESKNHMWSFSETKFAKVPSNLKAS